MAQLNMMFIGFTKYFVFVQRTMYAFLNINILRNDIIFIALHCMTSFKILLHFVFRLLFHEVFMTILQIVAVAQLHLRFGFRHIDL